MVEQLLVAYFNVCEPKLAAQSVVIQSNHISLESCQKTCKQLEDNTLDSRSCTHNFRNLNANGQRYEVEQKYLMPFKCTCNEK